MGMLGFKIDLAEDVADQIANAEEQEWTDPAGAEEAYDTINAIPDLPAEARIIAAAGRVRCAARQPGRSEEARAYMRELEAAGHGRLPEVKQAVALIQLLEHRPEGDTKLDELQAAATALPVDAAALRSY